MFKSLVEEMPKEAAKTLSPFLQRAEEFEKMRPVISYYLRTHVAFLAMQMHKKGTNTLTSFLSKLLGALEQEKAKLQPQLDGVDGRTELTKVALMLFKKADEAERSGCEANMNIVRLFFTSSVLFEATGQFMEDGEIDPVAAERRDYARFIAVRMKKSLDSGTTYVSPNAAKTPERQTAFGTSGGGGGDGSGAEQQMSELFPPEDNKQEENDNTYSPQPPPPPPPSSPSSSASYLRPPPPPASSFMTGVSNNGCDDNSKSDVDGTDGGPSMDAMINAQKIAKQAVGALQFYDYVTARKELLRALELLK